MGRFTNRPDSAVITIGDTDYTINYHHGWSSAVTDGSTFIPSLVSRGFSVSDVFSNGIVLATTQADKDLYLQNAFQSLGIGSQFGQLKYKYDAPPRRSGFVTAELR